MIYIYKSFIEFLIFNYWDIDDASFDDFVTDATRRDRRVVYDKARS